MRHYLAETEFEITEPVVDEIDGDELHRNLLAIAENEGMIHLAAGGPC